MSMKVFMQHVHVHVYVQVRNDGEIEDGCLGCDNKGLYSCAPT